ncbi:hypothetical protein, partial [Ensifer sp. OV372]|uniref:hypothetical protein n=1 Tax=Ensifer sp. OV372 TaxID=1855293 RepID=UPI001AEC9BB8
CARFSVFGGELLDHLDVAINVRHGPGNEAILPRRRVALRLGFPERELSRSKTGMQFVSIYREGSAGRRKKRQSPARSAQRLP